MRKLLRLALSEKDSSEIGRSMRNKIHSIAATIREKPGKVRTVLEAAATDVMTHRLGCKKLKIKW